MTRMFELLLVGKVPCGEALYVAQLSELVPVWLGAPPLAPAPRPHPLLRPLPGLMLQV